MLVAVRIGIALAVLALLARSARLAWRNRALAVAVWRRIRVVHVLGSAGLVVVVLAVALSLFVFVPVTGVGLGSLVGLSGNAVFAPLEEATHWADGDAAQPAPGSAEPGADPAGAGPGVGLVVVTTVFLAGLALLFPWLAYVEERVFREGLERAGVAEQAWRALKFGLAHLIMLIPVAAALGIAVAGFVYGRIYCRAYRAAAARTRVVPGPSGDPLSVAVPPEQARTEAVLASTVWHATFNTVIVILVLVGFVAEWTLRA